MKRLARTTILVGAALILAIAIPAATLAAPPGSHGYRHYGRGAPRHHVSHRHVPATVVPVYRPVVVPAHYYGFYPVPVGPMYGFGYSSPGFSLWIAR